MEMEESAAETHCHDNVLDFEVLQGDHHHGVETVVAWRVEAMLVSCTIHRKEYRNLRIRCLEGHGNGEKTHLAMLRTVKISPG